MWAQVIHELLVAINWFNFEYWSVSWPNVFAPSAWTLIGFVVADIRNARRHNVQKLHHINTVESLAGQLEVLSDKLVELLQGGTTDDDTIE